MPINLDSDDEDTARRKKRRKGGEDFTKGENRPNFAESSVIPLFFDAGAQQLKHSGVLSAGMKTYKSTDMCMRDYSERISLRNKHESRPITVFPDGLILFEAYSPLKKPVSDFLVAVAEPCWRKIQLIFGWTARWERNVAHKYH